MSVCAFEESPQQGNDEGEGRTGKDLYIKEKVFFSISPPWHDRIERREGGEDEERRVVSV